MLDVTPRDLRAIFDQEAELAEIGTGTGQATAALAARGAHVVGIEPGPALAAVLRRELADASLEVVVSAFED